jgi:hypothetical protein
MVMLQEPRINRRAVCLGLSSVFVGAVTKVGLGEDSAGAATAQFDTAATATRAAELGELADLRTQVALLSGAADCLPVGIATPSATPTLAPPAAMHEPVRYGEDWTVTANTVTMRPTFGIFTATGIYAQVSLTITNNTSASRTFPYEELVLRDERDRIFIPSQQVRILNEAGWYSPFPPNLPTGGFIVFDVATDAQGPFVVESTADPTFRIQVLVEIPG